MAPTPNLRQGTLPRLSRPTMHWGSWPLFSNPIAFQPIFPAGKSNFSSIPLVSSEILLDRTRSLGGFFLHKGKRGLGDLSPLKPTSGQQQQHGCDHIPVQHGTASTQTMRTWMTQLTSRKANTVIKWCRRDCNLQNNTIIECQGSTRWTLFALRQSMALHWLRYIVCIKRIIVQQASREPGSALNNAVYKKFNVVSP